MVGAGPVVVCAAPPVLEEPLRGSAGWRPYVYLQAYLVARQDGDWWSGVAFSVVRPRGGSELLARGEQVGNAAAHQPGPPPPLAVPSVRSEAHPVAPGRRRDYASAGERVRLPVLGDRLPVADSRGVAAGNGVASLHDVPGALGAIRIVQPPVVGVDGGTVGDCGLVGGEASGRAGVVDEARGHVVPDLPRARRSVYPRSGWSTYT